MSILELSFEVINKYIHTDDKAGLSSKIRGDIGHTNKMVRRIGYEVFIYLHKYCGFHNDSKGPGGSYDDDGKLEKPITLCELAYKHFTRPLDGNDTSFQSYKSYTDYVARYKHLYKNSHYTDDQFERILNAKHKGEGSWVGIAQIIDNEIAVERKAEEERQEREAIEKAGGHYEYLRQQKQQSITLNIESNKRKIEQVYAMKDITAKDAIKIIADEMAIKPMYTPKQLNSPALKQNQTIYFKKRLAHFYRGLAIIHAHNLLEESDDPFDVTDIEGYPETTRTVGGVAAELGVDSGADTDGNSEQ